MGPEGGITHEFCMSRESEIAKTYVTKEACTERRDSHGRELRDIKIGMTKIQDNQNKMLWGLLVLALMGVGSLTLTLFGHVLK